MKVGDLVRVKNDPDTWLGHGNEDWSNPSIVVGEYESPNEGLWSIWCDGIYCVIDDTNYEILHLTGS